MISNHPPAPTRREGHAPLHTVVESFGSVLSLQLAAFFLLQFEHPSVGQRGLVFPLVLSSLGIGTNVFLISSFPFPFSSALAPPSGILKNVARVRIAAGSAARDCSELSPSGSI